MAVFNYANESANLLRRQQDSLDDFKNNIDNMEHDYNNRLVEVYGRPYPDDCGPGRTYSTEYCQSGPDLYHYMYTDTSQFIGDSGMVPRVITRIFENHDEVTDDGQIIKGAPKEVKYYLDTDYRYGIVKPPEWQSKRQVPGRLQIAQADLLQLIGRYEQTLKEYDNLLLDITDQVALIEAQQFLSSEELRILSEDSQVQVSLNDAVTSAYDNQKSHALEATIALQVGNVVAAAFPLSAGFSFDLTSGFRAAAMAAAQIVAQAFSSESDSDYLAQLNNQHAKESQSALTNIKLVSVRGDFADDRLILELEKLVRSEAVLRLELDNIHESMKQTVQRYAAVLAEGVRIMQDRLRFRKQTAAKIQDYRYKDMSFRIFRNDALQKYRAQFDLAGLYTYLAAKAYDYETTLLDGETMAGQRFLTDIVRKRTIGMFDNGQPLLGSGLADPLKRMYQNFQVLKPQLGFNNPQIETNRFSLRQELFRVKMDETSNETWRRALQQHRVDDLWDIPEFRRFCRPFAEEGIPQPGIVIPFTTTVTSGLNFFEWPLGGGDSYYSATNFATKVRSVGVWFSNYNTVGLAQTPRIYLVPAGEDILRTPSYSTREIRTWEVVDQKLPVPFPIVNSELENNPGWIPSVDTIYDEMFAIRRHSDFRAYHDSGYLNQSEILYDSRLIGRSVWNTKWLLIIPGRSLLYDADEGLDTFIEGPEIWGGDG
ncbi:MAG: hypothetical protein IH612_01385, partial [Desulfofustis sp.]|nr:hypothetical protein [Desulfofustis sp.]